jgi:phosphate transport system substrate-binding protein
MKRLLRTLMAAGLFAAGSLSAQIQVDPALKPYASVSGVSGNLNSIGSDTLNNLMALWAEGIPGDLSERQHPDRGQGLLDGARRR